MKSSKMLKCIFKKKELIRIRVLFVAVMHRYDKATGGASQHKEHHHRKKVSLLIQNISCNIKLRAALEQDRRCCGLF